MPKPSKNKQKRDMRELFAGRRKWYAIGPGCLLLLLLGWFAYVKLTVIPPPDIKSSKPETMVDYMTDSRGWIQQPVQQREQYAMQMWEHYRQSSQDEQMRLARSFQSLSPAQQHVFAQASAGIIRNHVMDGAGKFNNLSTPAQRAEFVDKAWNDIHNVGSALAGGGPGGTGVNSGVGDVLRNAAPKNGDELQKVLITETTPGDRSKAEPFVNAMAQRGAEMQKEAKRNRGS